MAPPRIKLCIVMGGYWGNGRGGALQQVEYLLNELVDSQRYEIYYLARNITRRERSNGYVLVNVSFPNIITRHGFFFDTTRLYRLLTRIRPDVIYQRGVRAYAGIGAFYSRRHGSSQVLHIAHDYDVTPNRDQEIPLNKGFVPLMGIERKFGDYGLSRSCKIIAQTRKQDRLLRQHYDRKADAIIGNLHPAPSESIVKSPDIVNILWIANLKPFKRPEIFVRLAKDFYELSKARFVMVGHEGTRGEYDSLLEEVGAMENMSYLGELNIEEVNELLARADIFVNTSIAEGFPNTFIQAWLREVPVVSLGVDVNDILEKGEAGMRCDSYQELRGSVKNLIQDKSLRRLLGERARRLATEKFSMSNLKQIQAVIDSCAAEAK